MTAGELSPPTEALSARRSPYVGLDPYSEGDAPFFFGREGEQRIITANLRSSRLTLLYGSSGVGKSSVLMAGVVHGLREAVAQKAAPRANPRSLEVDERVPIAIAAFREWRPDRPLDRLIERIRLSAVEALGGEELAAWDGATPVIESLRAWTAQVRTLLVVLDQFEEYFLYHSDEDGDGSFARELPRIINAPALRVNFLISIREDAWAKLDRFKGAIPNLFGNYLRVDYLSWDSARRAIEGPVAEYNRQFANGDGSFAIDPALSEAVLEDVRTANLALAQVGDGTGEHESVAVPGEKQIETPFLQLVMQRLWDETVEQGARTLRLETLTQLGGAQEIVRSHLARYMDSLDEAQRKVAADVFRFLVTTSRTKISQRASDLADWTERPESEVVAVLERLSGGEQIRERGAGPPEGDETDRKSGEGRQPPDEGDPPARDRARILRPLRPPSGEEGTRYEIFHDVLAEAILDWRKRYEQQQQKEREKAELAERHEREEEENLRLEADRHKEQRDRLVRRATVGLGVMVVLLVVAATSAYLAGREARSRELAASAIAELPNDPERSVLLAREAWDVRQTDLAEEALRKAVGSSRVRAAFGGGPSSEIARALPSRDRRLVATEDSDGNVAIWQPESRTRLPLKLRLAEPLAALAFSPDGKSIVAGIEGEKAVIRRVDGSGQPIELPHGAVVRSAAFSPDGRYVATAGYGKGVQVWDAATAKRVKTLGDDDDFIDRVEFAPGKPGFLLTAMRFSGRTLAARRTATIWDWRKARRVELRRRGERTTHPAGDGAGFEAFAAFSPNGRYVLTSIDDSRTRVWDTRTGAFRFELEEKRKVTDVAWSPDGTRVLVASADKRAWLYDAANGRPVTVLNGHTDYVTDADFSPDGLVVTSSRDGTARVWEADSDVTVAELRGHNDQVTAALFTHDGKRVVTTGMDGTGRLWEVPRDRVLRGHRDWVLDAAYSPDGKRVVTASEDGTARIWDVTTGNYREVTGTDGGGLSSAEFDGAGRRVLVAGESPETERGDVVVADAVTGAMETFLSPEYEASAAFAPDGREIVTGSLATEIWPATFVPQRQDGALVQDPRARPKPLPLPTGGWALGAGYSPDGRRIVTAGQDGVARVFDARTRKQLQQFKRHGGVLYGAAFSRDGRRVVSHGADNTARVWDARTAGELAVMRGHTGWVSSAAFSPDGRYVVTGSADRTARVWDAGTGALVFQRQHADSVNSVVFSPDGRSILSGSDDRTARIFRCETCGSDEDLLELAKERVTRPLTADERKSFLADSDE